MESEKCETIANEPPSKKLKKEESEVMAKHATTNVLENVEVNSGLMGDNSSHDANYPYDQETQKTLEEIDLCQNEIDSLNEKASDEILTVEQKYNKLRKPFFEKRNDLIKNIPNFWMTAFINHPQLSEILRSEEADVLEYLTKIEVEEFEDIKSGYKIVMHFRPNPYFENEFLCKEFHQGTNGDPTTTSTEIIWKNNDSSKLLQDIICDKGRGKTPRSRRPNGSLFTWYMRDGDVSSDDIAEIIRDDLWTNPLQYFLSPDIDGENGGAVSADEEEDDEDEESEDGYGQEESIVPVEEDEEEDDEEQVYVVEDDDVSEGDYGNEGNDVDG